MESFEVVRVAGVMVAGGAQVGMIEEPGIVMHEFVSDGVLMVVGVVAAAEASADRAGIWARWSWTPCTPWS